MTYTPVPDDFPFFLSLESCLSFLGFSYEAHCVSLYVEQVVIKQECV